MLLKFITFSGREKTYQAWNGVPEPAITGNRAQPQTYFDNGELSEADTARVLAEGRRYTYDNQTDNLISTLLSRTRPEVMLN